jgi:hypothetical protein
MTKLGSLRPMHGQEVEALAGRVVQAADRATTAARTAPWRTRCRDMTLGAFMDRRVTGYLRNGPTAR